MAQKPGGSHSIRWHQQADACLEVLCVQQGREPQQVCQPLIGPATGSFRCIIGDCTYMLKGPHTSTLACHLKKHPAEYAEFQKLKVNSPFRSVLRLFSSAGTYDFAG